MKYMNDLKFIRGVKKLFSHFGFLERFSVHCVANPQSKPLPSKSHLQLYPE